MEHLAVECLRCGQERTIELRNEDECARCGYVGWAQSRTLDERTRRLLRERPLERRRLRLVAPDPSAATP
jgi:ribosomal protein L37E